MKRIIGLFMALLMCLSMFCGCAGDNAAKVVKSQDEAAVAKESAAESVAAGEAQEAGGAGIQSDAGDNELGWDGTWKGGNVEVTIKGSNNGSLEVYIVDEEMHTSLDEASINGNTLTGVYRITLEMYPDSDADLPEQEWTITMVKDGAHASYSRTAVLTWFSLNEDGTYGHTITKENSASLTLSTNSTTNK